jgi:hypothetical protein
MSKGRDKRKRLAKKREAEQKPKSEAPPPTDLQSGDADTSVRSPLKPKPHRNSGAIALPEPEELIDIAAGHQFAKP